MKRFILLFALGLIFAWIPAWSQPSAPRFEPQVIDSSISIGYGVTTGDVDGDGKPDVLLADKTRFVWYRNGDWNRHVLAENLTEHDNVAIAASDIDGDGRVEIAVGAQWNPNETTDPARSGSVHYLLRPQDPTQPWEPVRLYHEPTVHRMRWVRTGGSYSLVVLPLHGIGNRNGEGAGVRLRSYQVLEDPRRTWSTLVLDSVLHMTHNFDVVEDRGSDQSRVYVGGREGVRFIDYASGSWQAPRSLELPGSKGPGEVRIGYTNRRPSFLAAIEPMHGNQLAVYPLDASARRMLLDSTLAEGHALATADFLGLGYDQVAAGWRSPNTEGKVGIKLFVPSDSTLAEWKPYWIDENRMATEDLKAADLDNDGRPDLVASGRSTQNLIIYWNRTPPARSSE